MKCPADGGRLVVTERQGVEIDYCPDCRGVWLDRGELDKIIDRIAATQRSDGPSRNAASDDFDDDERPTSGRRRRQSMLGELFDFG